MGEAVLRKPRFWRWIGSGVAAVIVAGLIAAYVLVRPYGETGTTYLAKQLCSCVFLTGRTDSSCRGEFAPDIGKFSVRIDHAAGKVDARLLVFSNAATYQDGLGCRIER